MKIPRRILPEEKETKDIERIHKTRKIIQEIVRSSLAIVLVLGHIYMIYNIINLINKDEVSEDKREIITLIITSQGTLLASALGFYFGGKRD